MEMWMSRLGNTNLTVLSMCQPTNCVSIPTPSQQLSSPTEIIGTYQLNVMKELRYTLSMSLARCRRLVLQPDSEELWVSYRRDDFDQF